MDCQWGYYSPGFQFSYGSLGHRTQGGMTVERSSWKLRLPSYSSSVSQSRLSLDASVISKSPGVASAGIATLKVQSAPAAMLAHGCAALGFSPVSDPSEGISATAN